MKLELPERKKQVHTLSMPIRWGDMDALGHVNNTIYFRYLEVARLDWFAAIGCQVNPRGEGPLIVNAFCNFHKQLEYPGDAVVRMYVSDAGRTSFETWATIGRADDPGVVYASGGATTVWVDLPRQKSAPLPEWLRALLG
ncbi:MAG: acyl-ACP thioesterase family protein [Ramlibacter sp.]|jgi:acyl-CoA thioester hydrolase|uniref:acyl-CoA thioesterase n=1 Tax=Ramlibacter sp. TaxID=1917967 RepID=UPI002619BD2C|nr:thioesterase family protein [Ramlibacter sp.]MDB5749702.1 acyl-ACP thioesterase family protein [Ramlibacter sp.]